jgi:hypothetical protein
MWMALSIFVSICFKRMRHFAHKMPNTFSIIRRPREILGINDEMKNARYLS